MNDQIRTRVAMGIFAFLAIVVSLYMVSNLAARIEFVTTTTTTTIWVQTTIPRGQGR